MDAITNTGNGQPTAGGRLGKEARVDRASTKAWVGAALSLALTQGLASAQTPTAGDTVPAAGQTEARPSRVHVALNSGISSYRGGDYEVAAGFFKQAQAGQADLSAAERQDLASYVQRTNAALQARREGTDKLRQAEQMIQTGRTQDALLLVKAVAANQQFLSDLDKQKVQLLAETLKPATTNGASSALPLARAKLQQARLHMAKGNYAAAEALAQEAEQLGATYTASEDTPRKLMDDVARAKGGVVVKDGDAKSYVAAARQALEKGDLDMAEHLAKEGEKAGGSWTSLRLWGDSPGKVLKDVQAARGRQAASATKPASSGAPGFVALKSMFSREDKTAPAATVVQKPNETAKPMPNSDGARELVKQSRKAMHDGDYAKARQLANDARALKVEFSWYEDTPEKVLTDVQRVEGKAVAQAAKPKADLAGMPTHKEGDARAELKHARELFAAGKLDESERLAYHANADKKARWGVIEDTPDKLLAEIRKVRGKQAQEESVKLLADARKMADTANGDTKLLDEAEKMSYKAELLHGPYGVLDSGDRPEKLRADIDSARKKAKGAGLPPLPNTMMAQKPTDLKPTPPSGVVPVSGTDKHVAAMPAPEAPTLPPVPAPVTPTPVMPTLPTMASDTKKPQAQKLLADARMLQKDGMLIEARAKVVEAQKLGASYGPDEDRPETVLLAISAQCEKRVESLVHQAHDMASKDPTACAKAEACLTQARQLAEAFGLDTGEIKAKMAWVQQKQATPAAPGTPAPFVIPGGTAPMQTTGTPERGEALLAQARAELRRGEAGNARRLAEEAFNGKYGVQAEAEKLLRSIDAEEFNQRTLSANRSFDAGMAAYLRKDYTQASTMLQSLDRPLLSPERQSRLKEVMLSPEMQPSAVAQAAHKPDGAGHATATDQPVAKPEPTFAQQVNQLQAVKVQQLQAEGIRVMKDAQDKFKVGETDKAIEMLQEFSASLRTAGVEPQKAAELQRPVDARIQWFKTLKSQKDFETLSARSVENAQQSIQRQALAEQNKQKQVADLMKQYNSFFKEGKYDQAEMFAMRAKDLDPDNPMTDAAVYTARMMRNQTANDGVRNRQRNQTVNALQDAGDVGPEVNTSRPIRFDQAVSRSNVNRKSGEVISFGTSKSAKERQIQSRMNEPVRVSFKDKPLKDVFNELREMTGINIVPDEPALGEEGISLDRPITINLDGVSLKSALNLILHQVHLTHMIKDEVLQITTPSHAKGKLELRTYNVADLVIPVQDSTGSNSLLDSLRAGNEVQNLKVNGASPWLASNAMSGGREVSPGMSGNLPGMAPQGVTKTGPKNTMEDLLIKMITNIIDPDSWDSMGGKGHIEYYPLGMAMMISQTPDIQEQISELLAALRRLQDQEVSVEVRFITIAESFFERIGVDFNVNIKTDKYTTKYEPQLVSQQFKPFGFVNDFNPSNTVIGLQPGNSFTQDLDIPIRTSSFAQAIPPFGAFPGIPGGNGGIDLGLAFLSDIQVFLFMEAAQGDQRTNVMQAPKLTLFNGQTATITVSDQQFFVTNVTVVQAGGQVIFVPQNTPIPTGGVTMAIQAVISADRRFVRLNITPTITNIASAVVQLFPITAFITPVFEGGATGQPVPFTQFLQQPVFNTITVATTVAVPDGGTVLLGGLKRMSEGRNEFGPPILSKLPVINRLFKNVGYGREAESLLLMVTPRIIINAEEEERQTGVDSSRAGAAGENR